LKSGFVSILGRPNAGKSTLLNALIGEKVAIVTPKAQTTRNRIIGVLEVAAKKAQHPAAQIVFVDTPGVHRANSHLDKKMMQEVHEALQTRDVLLLMIDAAKQVQLAEEPKGRGAADKQEQERKEEESVFALIRDLDCPIFLVLNKIDLVPREKLLPMITELTAKAKFAEVLPISARKKDGLDLLFKRVIEALPTGERYFPKEQYTDQPERFMVAELIRERILLDTGEEIPYAAAVVIEQYEEPDEEQLRIAKKFKKLPVTHISAVIYCERAGQKAILIGKGGTKLKEIGTGARKEIESLLGTRVYLELRVIVEPKWRESRGFVESLDWRRQLEELSVRQSNEEGSEE
jgi:GTP-binding protein Era